MNLITPTLLLCSLIAGSCASTVRLTPGAADLLAKDDRVDEAKRRVQGAHRVLEASDTLVRSVISQLRQDATLRREACEYFGVRFLEVSGDAGAAEATLESLYAAYLPSLHLGEGRPSQEELFARQSSLASAMLEANRARGRSGQARLFTDLLDPYPEQSVLLGSNRTFASDTLESYERDFQQIQQIESGRWEYFVEGSVFFSIEPLIAVRPNLNAVAIPSIAINWRPYNLADLSELDTSFVSPGLSAAALQVTLGGALNPGGGGGNSAESMGGAVGAGVSYPVAGIGSLSVGHVWYQGANRDDHSAIYLSLNLGDFGAETPSD